MAIRYVLTICILFLLAAISNGQVTWQANVTSGCGPLIVNFTSNAAPSSSYLWEFGNGNTSALPTPSTIYHTAGFYTVKLTVTSPAGLVTHLEKKDYIEVFAKPEADFKLLSPPNGCVPLTVRLSNQSKANGAPIVRYAWDLAQGFGSSQENPTIQLTLTGDFSVTLAVWDANNCSHVVTRQKQVNVYAPPVPEFTATGNHTCLPPANVAFTNRSTNSFSGGLSYQWYFGNGDSSHAKDPSVTYNTAGFFPVTLRVTDINGCSRVQRKDDFVKIEKPVAAFKTSASVLCAPDRLYFQNTTLPQISGTQYRWVYGPGDTLQGFNSDHFYKVAGTYTIKLMAQTPLGCTSETEKQIVVYDKPQVDFTSPDTTGCQSPHTVKLTATGSNVSSYLWKLDTLVSTQASPTFVLNDTGYFDVSLKVTSTNGCVNEIAKSAFIRVSPTRTMIVADRKSGCAPLPVQFRDSTYTAGIITGYRWNFGDSTVSNLANPLHVFTDTGYFMVELTVYDNLGCETRSYLQVMAGLKPQTPEFTADKREGCIGDLLVQFQNLTPEAPIRPTAYSWNLGGDVSPMRDPLKLYDIDSGWYDVVLTAAHYGCTDSVVKKNYIHVLGAKARIRAVRSDCDPDSVKLFNESKAGHIFQWTLKEPGGPGIVILDTFTFSLDYPFPAGNFIAVLRVTDTISHCVDEESVLMQVPLRKYPAFGNKPGACAPETITFFNNRWKEVSWVLSDGRTFTGNDPAVEFTVPGVYHMTMNVVDSLGCKKSYRKENAVTVSGFGIVSRIQGLEGCAPHTVMLHDSSFGTYSGNDTRWWDMGNGTLLPVTAEYMSYVYTAAPAIQSKGYTVSYKVKDTTGCVASQTHQVKVLAPKAKIGLEQTPSCTFPEYILYSDENLQTGFGPFTYSWYLGNGDSAHIAQPTKVFDTEGSYVIRLVLRDYLNCTGEDTVTFNPVHRQLKADFTADNTSQDCPPMFVNFKDSTTLGYAPIRAYQWEFGDGTIGNIEDPDKLYRNPGRYDVKLSVVDMYGCNSSILKKEYIRVGGPTGTFTIQPDEGCAPLVVTFKSNTKATNRVRWDSGDGLLLEGDTTEYEYNRAGTYLPSMILSDEFGCTYAMPPKDIITVHDNPTPDFQVNVSCSGDATKFTNYTNHGNMRDVASVYWDFGDGNSAISLDAVHTYLKPGLYHVKLRVSNAGGCHDSVIKQIEVPGVEGSLKSTLSYACIGKPVDFTADVTSYKTNIISVYWDFGDGTGSDSFTREVSHVFKTPGKYNISYQVITDKGCSETYLLNGFIAGDTVPPPAPILYYATVDNEQQVSFAFSRDKDVDFGTYLLYRINPDESLFPVSFHGGNADTLVFDQGLQTSKNVYRYYVQNKNICGFISRIAESEVHATIELKAVPDTNAVNLSWTHYQGWDAINRYVVQRAALNGTFDSIGWVDGAFKTYTDSGIVCYRTYVYRIKAVEKNGYYQQSLSDTAIATPYHKGRVPVPEMQRVSAEGENNVIVEWKKPQQERYGLTGFFVERSDDGSRFEPLSVQNPNMLTANNAAYTLLQPYYYRLMLRDSCGDYSEYSPVSKTIHLRVDTTDEEKPVLRWNHYQGWQTGIKEYQVFRLESNGDFAQIASVSPADSVYTDQAVPYNGRDNYCYRIRAIRNPGDTMIYSWSNPDCAPVRPRLFIPNAFTPNSNSLNDRFFVKGVFIYKYEINIYNRWGELLYTGTDMDSGWDGTFRNSPASQDVYMYHIKAMGAGGIPLTYSGTITLLR